MILSLIVAASENNVIGVKNTLPWHLPDDLRYFRSTTKGHPIVMGRKTFDSIGHPLPGRRNIVVSRSTKSIAGCDVFSSLADVLLDPTIQQEEGEVFIIGGAQIFAEALMEILEKVRVHRLYLTRVHAQIEGDVFLPDINWKHWKLASSQYHPHDASHQYSFTFEVYERVVQ